MAVLIEAISVVIKRTAIDDRYSGGWDAFVKDAPNQTLCADEHLARVGFMTPIDVESFIKRLELHGLVHLKDGIAQDIVVADQQRGVTTRCDWSEFGDVEIDRNSVKACKAVVDASSQLISPDGWVFEGSLSQTFMFTPTEHVDKSLTFLRHEDSLDVYLNALTGEEVYLGRTGKT